MLIRIFPSSQTLILASASMLDLSVADVTNDSCYGADDALLILRYTLDLIDHL